MIILMYDYILVATPRVLDLHEKTEEYYIAS